MPSAFAGPACRAVEAVRGDDEPGAQWPGRAGWVRMAGRSACARGHRMKERGLAGTPPVAGRGWEGKGQMVTGVFPLSVFTLTLPGEESVEVTPGRVKETDE